jgi:hypothetical protein
MDYLAPCRALSPVSQHTVILVTYEVMLPHIVDHPKVWLLLFLLLEISKMSYDVHHPASPVRNAITIALKDSILLIAEGATCCSWWFTTSKMRNAMT